MESEEERTARRRVTFVHDARRRLATLSDSLLALERDPTDRAALDETLRALHTLKGNAGLVGLETLAATVHALEGALAEPRHPPPAALLLRGLDALSAMVATLAESLHQPTPPIPVVEALAAVPPGTHAAPTREAHPAARPDTLHSPQVTVPVSHLDNLLELVEELRDTHSRLAQAPSETPQTLERHLARQRRLLHELHDALLQARLLPVRQAFDGFERLVRDLAASTGRQAQLVIAGADTEIDRSALEPVRDLLVHLLRNALAHALEPPEERLAAGKPAAGTVRLTAQAEGDGVVLEVADDGRGLDRQQVMARAVALGMCTAEEAAQMGDAQLWAFLTRPGFSTHDHVDQVSGRGMGLNAVRQGVEALRGRLEITSQPGVGMTVRLRLPTMMALEEVVLVQVGPETYAIPQASIDRAGPAGKDEDIPTLDLWERLQVPGDAPPADRTLIVCQCSRGQVGLLADGVVGRDAVAIRPLPQRARCSGLLGAMVTGAGRVVLVLDVERLT
ncbi:MAG: chemotaxis protein CheA [Anaerolineae bacterium]